VYLSGFFDICFGGSYYWVKNVLVPGLDGGSQTDININGAATKGIMARSFLCIVCAVLVAMSVSVCPVVAQRPAGEQIDAAGQRYMEGFEGLLTSGTVNLTTISALSVFKDAGIRGIDIQVGAVRSRRSGAVDSYENETVVRDGLFTITTRGGGDDRPARGGPDTVSDGLVKNMSALGYALTGTTTDPYETSISFAHVPGIPNARLDATGFSRSAENPNTLTARGRISTYTFTNMTTGDTVDVTVTHPTDATGEAVGGLTMSVSRLGSVEKGVIVVTGSGGVGLVSGLATAYLLGGAAAVTEATPLLGGAAAVCLGLSATGVGVVVGVAVAVIVAGVLAYYYFSADDLAPVFLTTGASPPHYYISVSDGTTVWNDGSVTFPLDPTTPPPPGTDWVQATRKAALTRTGALWMLNHLGTTWEKYPTDHRYTAIAQTGSWVAAIATEPDGGTYLEIPTGPGQPAADSHIRSDVAALNAGKNPHHHHWGTDTTIDPPIPGWKCFVPGTDYGLALTTDGRVFGVGTNKDHQADLNGRYTKISTAVHNGRLENDRYSLGIRSTDGGIDFTGDDPNHIKDDIKTANLDHVIAIAAGPDRAIAITRHGGVVVFGNNAAWAGTPPSQPTTGPYSSVTASVLPAGKSVFLASVETGIDTFVPSNAPVWSPTPEDWVFIETAVNASTLSSAEKAFVIGRLHLINDNGGRRKGEVSLEGRQQVERRAMECILQYYRIDDRSGSGRDRRWSGCFGYCADGTHNNLAEIAGLKMGVPSEYTHILNEHSSDPDAWGVWQMPNHYSCGGAGDKSEEYANVARTHYRAGRYELAYTNLSWAMHFMSDVGNPWHTTYDPVVQLHHVGYELDYVEGQFVSDFKQPLLNTPARNNYCITDVSESAQRLADFSNRKLSYLNRVIELDPNWKSNVTVKARTLELLQETLRYNEGLVNYVQL
jgi:hypothetical protein